MPTSSPAELIQALARNRDELLSACASLTEEQIGKFTVVGRWTIKDIVGHISHAEQLVLDHVRESLKEGKPRPTSLQDSNDKLNAREAKKRQGWKWQRVRAEFENTRRALIDRVSTLSELELSFIVPNPWWNHEAEFYSIGQMIKDDAISHCAEHLSQIQEWIAAQTP